MGLAATVLSHLLANIVMRPVGPGARVPSSAFLPSTAAQGKPGCSSADVASRIPTPRVALRMHHLQRSKGPVMQPRAPTWLQNLLLFTTSILALLIVCELVVFRYIVLPTDFPKEAFIDGVIRFEPGQKGVTRWRNEIMAPFAINEQGWNSGLASYGNSRVDGLGRIAIIGDSYVNAMTVPFDASFAELTQARMSESGCPVEVFRFGMPGAPLSHYLYVLLREIIEYKPDLVVILLIHNDFDESFLFKPGRYTSSFLKLRLDDGIVSQEIQPHPYSPGFFDRLRLSGMFRYFYYTQGVRLEYLRRLAFGVAPNGFEANIDVAKTMELFNSVSSATNYTLGQMARVTQEHGIGLVIMMDGHRQVIYGEAPADRAYGPLALNALVGEVAQVYDLPFIDLHDHFSRDWRRRGLRFEYDTDWHWNVLAHRFVADVLVDFLGSRKSMLGCGD